MWWKRWFIVDKRESRAGGRNRDFWESQERTEPDLSHVRRRGTGKQERSRRPNVGSLGQATDQETAVDNG